MESYTENMKWNMWLVDCMLTVLEIGPSYKIADESSTVKLVGWPRIKEVDDHNFILFDFYSFSVYSSLICDTKKDYYEQSWSDEICIS